MAVQGNDEILTGGPSRRPAAGTAAHTDFNVTGISHWDATGWDKAAAVCSQKWRKYTPLYMQALPGLKSAAAYFSTLNGEARDHAKGVARQKTGKDKVWESKFAEDQLRQVYSKLTELTGVGTDTEYVANFEKQYNRPPADSKSTDAAVKAMTYLATATEWPDFQERVQAKMASPPVTLADAALQIAFVAKGFVHKDAYPVPPHCPECLARRKLAPPRLVEPHEINLREIYEPTGRRGTSQRPPQQQHAERRTPVQRPQQQPQRPRPQRPRYPRPEPPDLTANVTVNVDTQPEEAQAPQAPNYVAFPPGGLPPSNYYGPPAQPQYQYQTEAAFPEAEAFPFYFPPPPPAAAYFGNFGAPAPFDAFGVFGGNSRGFGAFQNTDNGVSNTDSGNTTTIVVNYGDSDGDGFNFGGGNFDFGNGGGGNGGGYDGFEDGLEEGFEDVDNNGFDDGVGDDPLFGMFTGGPSPEDGDFDGEDMTSGGEGDNYTASSTPWSAVDDEDPPPLGEDVESQYVGSNMTSGGEGDGGFDDGEDMTSGGGEGEGGFDDGENAGLTSGGVVSFFADIIGYGGGGSANDDDVPDDDVPPDEAEEENAVPLDEEPEDPVSINLFGTGSADARFDLDLGIELVTGGPDDGTLYDEEGAQEDDESLFEIEAACDDDGSCALT